MTKRTSQRLNLVLGLGLATMLVLFLVRSAETQQDQYSEVPSGNESRTSNTIPSYARPPAATNRVVPKGEKALYLNAVLDTLFKRATNFSNMSEEEKCIRILKYVSSVLLVKANQGSASHILRTGYALCYGRSKAFTMLCRKAGLPSRIISAMYVPGMGSHVVSEAYYDGGWHLFDATYGMFFYSDPEYDGEGSVISFHDLASYPSNGTPFIVVPAVGSGRYGEDVASYAARKVEDEEHTFIDDVFSVDSYRESIRLANPIAYGSTDLVSYPVDANLVQQRSKWFGRVDKSDGDLALYQDRFSGSHYVGNANPPAFHTWLIKAKPLTTVRIEYYSVPSNPPKLTLLPLRAAKLIDQTTSAQKTTFTVQAIESEAIVSVYSPDRYYKVDAMRIYR